MKGMIIMETEVQKKVDRFTMSTDARILSNMIEKIMIREDNDFASYQTLSASISRNVQTDARGILNTARKSIEEEYGVFLETVRNEGIKKTIDMNGSADNTITHVRKFTHKRNKRLSRVLRNHPDTLNSEVAAKMGILGAMELLSRPKAPKKLIEYIQEKKIKEISTAETLKLFSNGKS
jgi:hypothetical protein